jgi:uncharacterized protein YneF (UPF0154 family)
MRRNTVFGVALALLFVIFGTIFAVVQQFVRASANDPQIQLAEITASALDNGTPPSRLISGSVEMDNNLSPFVMIYDKSGKLLSGNGLLDNKAVKVPAGMLAAANGREYSAVTWQPKKNVRIAAVTVSARNYFVVSGRSLKEVEKREQQSMNIAMAGGVLAAGVVFGGMYVDMRARKQAENAAKLASVIAETTEAPITAAAEKPKKQNRRRK